MNSNPDLQPDEFLLASMMFLVFDGGHSIHEVLWTANQIEAGRDDAASFVSDIRTFAARPGPIPGGAG